jgi:integrase
MLEESSQMKEKHDDAAKIITELRAENALLRSLVTKPLTGRLTASKIERLTRAGQHCDGGGLYVQINRDSKGGKSWLFRYRDRVTHKIRWLGLGSLRDISIEKARELALHYRQMLLEHKDPKQEREAAKLDIVIARGKIKSLQEVIDEWSDGKIVEKSPAYRRKVENQIKKYITPTIGEMPIQKVSVDIILEDIVESADGKPKPGVGIRKMWRELFPTADNLLSYLDRIFDYASRQGYYEGNNPAVLARDKLPAKDDVYQREQRPSLPFQQVGKFLQDVDNYEDRSVRKTGKPNIAFLMKAVTLTGVRISEWRLAEWKEIDLEKNIWNVPWQHRKHGRQKRMKRPIRPIPITESLRAVLDEMQKRRMDHSPEGLIFPSARTGRAISTSEPSRFIKENLRWDIEITPHGFRTTLRDWMRTRTRFREILWKIQVDHKIGDDAADDAYGTENPLYEERCQMMELWDGYCSKPEPELTAGKLFNLSDKRRYA